MSFEIREDDPRSPPAIALLEAHLAHCWGAGAPPESTHVMDVEALCTPAMTFWTAWLEARAVACGALKEIDPRHGEIKSMHTLERCRGQGVAAAMLKHIVEAARGRGYRRVSLETGSTEAFAAARAFYERHGFAPCPPFEGYREDPNSVFMTLMLDAE